MEINPTILIVDDTETNIDILVEVLKEYDVVVALDGATALEIIQQESIDLILLDVMMPVMDGYQVCQELKKNPNTKEIPIIFLTAKIQPDDEIRGLELGAVDYITKPFNPPIVCSRIRNHLLLKKAQDLLKNHNERLEYEVQERTKDISAIQDVTINAMASLVETRDNETGGHILRTQNYILLLIDYLQDHPRFKDELTPNNKEMIYKSAPLHDIGKIGIPDYVLHKPGKLSPEEFDIMKTHTLLGYDAILSAEKVLPNTKLSFLHFARQIALSHHEKWDGTGYPNGLKGDEIPIAARFMALADVYDALISKRAYKEAMAHEQAVEIILRGKEIHFDPDIVDAFQKLHKRFKQIADTYE
jgi:putative two-component system response regulator